MNNEFCTLEQQIFNWESWVELGHDDFEFTGVTLKVDLDGAEVGEQFDFACWFGSDSTLQLIKNEKILSYKIKVSLTRDYA